MTEAPPQSKLLANTEKLVFDPNEFARDTPVHAQTGANLGTFDPRTYKLGDYIDTNTLAPPPKSCHHEHYTFNWQMLLNDRYGDCVEAAQMHMKMKWCLEAGTPQPPVTDAATEALYTAEGGFNPKYPTKSDNGTDPMTACQYWVNTGILGDKAAAYLAVNKYDYKEVKYAIWMFGGLFTAWNLPLAYQTASIWGTSANGPTGNWLPGSWGGHMTVSAAYDGWHVPQITWGGITLATWKAFGTYAAQGSCFIILDPEILNGNTSPAGFNWQQLNADMGNAIV